MTIQKFNIRAGIAILIFLCLNCYMNYVEIEALNKRLHDKTLLCIKTGEIKSRHNIILDCSEVK